jgi:murein DD-endopeptidase MepM/ murein hydrolase activator NlpD
MDQANPIVPEKLLRLVRSTAVRRTLLAAVLPFFGVVAAFGIAPDTVTEKIAVKSVVEEVSLAAAPSAPAGEEAYTREERIYRGDTIASVLSRLRVEDQDAIRFMRSSAEAKPLRQLATGRTMRARTTEDGKLIDLRYSNAGALVVVKSNGDTFQVDEQAAPLERRLLMKSAEIRSSLFAATDAAQLTDAVAGQIADIFSTDIDFHKDLRRGDRFTIVYEMFFDGGEPVRSGKVVAAEFVNAGRAYQAVWFQHADGQGGYYTLDGKNIKKAFLRSPLEFSRITSGFTTARFHPVLQRWRAHTGVDYGAPSGTGVKATADGVVEFAGTKGGYGNVVILRHQSKYTTLYGHLSAFGRGIRNGSRVSQGDIIGYVGSTGLATGPHLHYEFRINDVHQDPLKVAMPDAPPITPDLRAMFEAVARPLGLRLGLLRNTNLARLE